MVAQPKPDDDKKPEITADMMSEEEYLAMERESEIKHEYVGGRVYAMSGASEAHIDIMMAIGTGLYNALRGRPCKVYSADMRVYVASIESYFYPDITVVCGERQFLDEPRAATLTNPTVIIEVLSPSTELRDRTSKFQHYQQIASLRDYVLVQQTAPHIECYSRGENDSWILTQATGLDTALKIPALDLSLTLRDVYAQVTFPPEEGPEPPSTETETDSD